MSTAKRPAEGEPLRALVIGVGHLGKNHARVYSEIPGVELAGVVDPDRERGEEVAKRFGVPYHPELDEGVLAGVHAASVVTPTPLHFEVASRCIEAGVSTLVEKPITSTVEEARALCERASSAGVTLQVGHIERFNPVVLAALPYIDEPIFIECDRIHPFSFRSVETSVVLDLMIHDIDLVLQIVASPVDRLDAAGARILSPTEDLASTRMTFENGCTAMFKASRVAIQKSRKMRIFCEKCYVSLDHAAKTGMVISLKDGFDRDRIDFREMARLEESKGTMSIFSEYLDLRQLQIRDIEPLRGELEAFVEAVRTDTPPVVTGEHGLQAVEVALRILQAIERCENDVRRRRHRERPEGG